MTNFVIPLPELVKAGKWEKENIDFDKEVTEAHLSKQKIQVPCDTSPASVAIRAHEYLHIKWSPEKKPSGDKSFQAALSAFEDERVNLLGKQYQKVDVTPVKNLVTVKRLANVAGDPFLTAIMYVGSRQYELHDDVEEFLSSNIGDFKPQVDKLVSDLQTMPSFEMAVHCSKELVELMLTPPPPPPPQSPSEQQKEPDFEPEEGDSNITGQGEGDGEREGEGEEKSEVEQDGEEDNEDEGEGTEGEGTEGEGTEGEGTEGEGTEGEESGGECGDSSGGGKQKEMSEEELKEYRANAKRDMKESLKKVKICSIEELAREEANNRDAMEINSEFPIIFEGREKKNTVVLSGKLIIREPQLRNFRAIKGKIKGNKKATDFGHVMRYPHRIMTDKIIFGGHKKLNAGTVLIDCSGSMRIRKEMLENVIINSKGVKIAGYCAISGCDPAGFDPSFKDDDSRHYNTGILEILAEKGMVVNKISRDIAGRNCNIVDIPALKWLGKQRGPRIWVSDGLITGIGHWWTVDMRREMLQLLKKHKIKWIKSLGEFQKYLGLKEV